MARLNVNPTRMELRRLKERLATAKKGHKLLKDKSDEMIRQFMNFAKENRVLRKEAEEELSEALRAFMLARAVADNAAIEEAIMMPAYTAEISCELQNVMGIDVPKMSIDTKGGKNELPYALTSVTGELDESVLKLSKVLEKLLRLAEVEKTCNMLADEIVKNRRRVNALEYVTIPDCEETIKYIMMKLDENERSTLIRLMKVKSGINGEEN